MLSLKKTLSFLINTISGQKIIWSNQNSPTPDGDYIILEIESIKTPGSTDFYSRPNAQGVLRTQGNKEITLSLISVSKNSMEIVSNLIDELKSEINSNLLFQNKIAYVKIENEPIDITVKIGNNFESRVSVDLIFRISKNFGSSDTLQVETVEGVSYEGDLVTNSGNTITVEGTV